MSSDQAVADHGLAAAPPLPYGRQWIEEDDVRAVVEALRSDWLTTGPAVDRFEREFAEFVGAAEGVAVSNGTAALHAAMHAVGVGPGDEVVVPALTFAASANCVVYQGGRPVFADVDRATLLLDPASVAARMSARTRAIIAVDYAGQPCDYAALREIAARHGAALVADAAHAAGGADGGRRVGALADLTTFSFHPVKQLTTGEGGMVTTDEPRLARAMRVFRNHGITTDHRQREARGDFAYEMVTLGFNYRITDIQCALGSSQLAKLPRFVAARRAIAARYDAAFDGHSALEPVRVRAGVHHAYHLYPIRLRDSLGAADRRAVYRALRRAGLGVNVHYMPVHLHPFYTARFATGPGLCPVAEASAERLISLPMFARMTDADVERVIGDVRDALKAYEA